MTTQSNALSMLEALETRSANAVTITLSSDLVLRGKAMSPAADGSARTYFSAPLKNPDGSLIGFVNISSRLVRGILGSEVANLVPLVVTPAGVTLGSGAVLKCTESPSRNGGASAFWIDYIQPDSAEDLSEEVQG